MAVTRTEFRTLSRGDTEYYIANEERDPVYYPYPFVCHACHERLLAGQQWCYLFNTSRDHLIWCQACAGGFPLEEGY